MIAARELPTLIQVDGGVKASNARKIREAGADILVAGTAIFRERDYATAIQSLRE